MRTAAYPYTYCCISIRVQCLCTYQHPCRHCCILQHDLLITLHILLILLPVLLCAIQARCPPRALQVATEAGLVPEADKLTQQASRKFPTSKKVWIARVQHVSTHQTPNAAHQVVERALKSLPVRKHVAFLGSAAVASYRGGNVERGRALFESLMRHHPKRLDLWILYAD